MTTSMEATYERLNSLRASLPLLDEALHVGTPRRWSERDLTAEQRVRQDALAVLERHAKEVNAAKGIKTLGNSKAPLRIDVLDARRDIATALAELEDAVTERLGITSLIGVTMATRIGRLVGLLDRVALHPDLADHVHAEAVQLAHAAARGIGDVEAVHRMNARCPHCDSRSMRALPERELVSCVNDSCRCDDDECQCHSATPRRHRWPYSQWPNLAELLIIKDAK